MSYETVVTITQTVALIFFILLFLMVVVYALWPGNREKFKRAARLPFEAGETREKNGVH